MTKIHAIGDSHSILYFVPTTTQQIEIFFIIQIE